MPVLHVHGRGHEALAAGDVGRQRLVSGRLQVVDQDRGGAAVQGSAGLVVQVLQKTTAVENLYSLEKLSKRPGLKFLMSNIFDADRKCANED